MNKNYVEIPKLNSYGYPACSRIEYPNGKVIRNKNGYIEKVTNSNGVIIYEYDENNNVILMKSSGFNPCTTRFKYDDKNNCIEISHLHSNIVSDYGSEYTNIPVNDVHFDHSNTTQFTYDKNTNGLIESVSTVKTKKRFKNPIF